MRVARFLIELLIVLVGAIAAGFLIGAIQHFVAFGVWGYGFRKDALKLAAWEGGIVGGMLGIPTGLFVYYAVLKGSATPKLVGIVLGGSLVGGCALGALTFVLSALLTPILTIGISSWARKYGPTTAGTITAKA